MNRLRQRDEMAVKRLNAMGIEAKSWYQKGKESTSDISSKPPMEENNWSYSQNEGRKRSKLLGGGHFFNDFLISLCSPVRFQYNGVIPAPAS